MHPSACLQAERGYSDTALSVCNAVLQHVRSACLRNPLVFERWVLDAAAAAVQETQLPQGWAQAAAAGDAAAGTAEETVAATPEAALLRVRMCPMAP